MILLISTITAVEHHFSTDDNVEEMETSLTESKFNLVSISIYMYSLIQKENLQIMHVHQVTQNVRILFILVVIILFLFKAEDSAIFGHKIPFPRNMGEKFKDMRIKFGSTFYNVRLLFSKKWAKSQKDINKMKALLADCFPDLKSELSVAKTIDGVLDVVKRKCSIVDVRPLEVLAQQFKIKKAEDIIRKHKEAAEEFCKSVSVSLSSDETLQAIPTRYLLCETITFVLNRNPDSTTLQDINDVLLELELLQKYHIELEVINARKGQSVVVTCYCPAEYTTSLIVAVLDKEKILQKRGFKEFLIGNNAILKNIAHEV